MCDLNSGVFFNNFKMQALVMAVNYAYQLTVLEITSSHNLSRNFNERIFLKQFKPNMLYDKYF